MVITIMIMVLYSFLKRIIFFIFLNMFLIEIELFSHLPFPLPGHPRYPPFTPFHTSTPSQVDSLFWLENFICDQVDRYQWKRWPSWGNTFDKVLENWVFMVCTRLSMKPWSRHGATKRKGIFLSQRESRLQRSETMLSQNKTPEVSRKSTLANQQDLEPRSGFLFSLLHAETSRASKAAIVPAYVPLRLLFTWVNQWNEELRGLPLSCCSRGQSLACLCF